MKRRIGAIASAAALLATTAILGVVLVAVLQRGSDRSLETSSSVRLANGPNGIQAPADLEVKLFADSKQVSNPVALAVDDHGRVFAAETARLISPILSTDGVGVTIKEDLASRSVADRLALLKIRVANHPDLAPRLSERVRLIEDLDGDGRADRASVFAEGFDDLETGLGAGLLTRGDDVYFTCVPTLWKLADPKKTGRATDRKQLFTGFGVHLSGVGHGLHGLTWGPDGKLYFSNGDSGLRVATLDGRIVVAPDTGSILRCDPDGSNLELFAGGLRNPEELAFNELGDLFTADNDQDPGDLSRIVHVVEGSDGGWRYGVLPVTEGPWIKERLWDVAWDGQAAFVSPPVAALPDLRGPCGLAAYPGTGLPARFDGSLFLCNFGYVAQSSGVLQLKFKPKGASYELLNVQPFLTGIIPTDVEFAPDGGLLATAWDEGGGPSTRNAIYRVFDPRAIDRPEVVEVKTLLSKGAAALSIHALIDLLDHADVRVRRMAQFALAARGTAAVPELSAALWGTLKNGDRPRLARLHALWALAQIARRAPEVFIQTIGLLKDADPEIRAQAAKVMGDGRVELLLVNGLFDLVHDESPRVRFQTAIALGKIKDARAMKPLLEMLRDNADRDPFLRHAAVLGLAGIDNFNGLLKAARDPSPSVRMGVLLAFRRLGRGDVARFLDDPDPRLAVEAARAIDDEPIASALPDLAAIADRPGLPEPLLRRALSANAQLGRDQDAARLANAAADRALPVDLRVLALKALLDWADPPDFDPATGYYRPLPPRSTKGLAEPLRQTLPKILGGRELEPCLLAIDLAERFEIRETVPLLVSLAESTREVSKLRARSLAALDRLQNPASAELLERLVLDRDGLVRIAAAKFLGKTRPERAVPLLEREADNGVLADRQAAWTALGEIPGRVADAAIGRGLERLLKNAIEADVRLELVEAARRRDDPLVQSLLRRIAQAKPAADRLGARNASLQGGDPVAGRAVFAKGSSELACVRCHSIENIMAGGNVGPDLAGLGARKDREYILQSLVDPNAQIADGFESVVLGLVDGRVVSGVLKQETAKELILKTAEGNEITIAKSDIDDRTRGRSAMPDDISKGFSDRELRDLVAFLASLGQERTLKARLVRLQTQIPRPSPSKLIQAGLR